MSLQILLSGATGAVGQIIADLIAADEHAILSGRASREQFFKPDLEADVIIDFSHPDLLEQVLRFATRHRIPLVTGTTALGDALQARLVEASDFIPVCQAANFSLGMNLLVELARRAAAALGEAYDVEILDIHHRRKIDAPSGTALWLGQAVAAARGLDFAPSVVHDRSSSRQARRDAEIGLHAVRGGDVAGEHTVYFLGEGERVELTHRSTNRQVFARGALLAARRLPGRPPGLVDFAELVLQPR